MGPVPLDDVHQWLPYRLTRADARQHFTRPWERLGIPFVLLADDGVTQLPPADDDTLVMIYAHQHVKLTPVLGRWCCTDPRPVDSVALSTVYQKECTFCEQPAKARHMCWMHYSRMTRHGDPYQARPYHSSRPRHAAGAEAGR